MRSGPGSLGHQDSISLLLIYYWQLSVLWGKPELMLYKPDRSVYLFKSEEF